MFVEEALEKQIRLKTESVQAEEEALSSYAKTGSIITCTEDVKHKDDDDDERFSDAKGDEGMHPKAFEYLKDLSESDAYG